MIDGCVIVELKLAYAGDFELGSICNDCPEEPINLVRMKGPDKIYLKFREKGTGLLKEEPITLTSQEQSSIRIGYKLENDPPPVNCHVVTTVEANGPQVVAKSLNSSSQMTGNKCWELKEVIIGRDDDLWQEFLYDIAVVLGGGAEDLVTTEKIEENGYSVFLEYVRYDWQ